MNDTVIYRHLKPCGEVFYVGIGCEQRPYSKWHRNKFWHNIVKKYPNYEVNILKSDLSWSEACELEEILIDYYGRRDLGTGSLVNLTNGGEGAKGLVHSEESKQKMSAANSGKNNYNYGKKRSKETRKKISAAQQGKNHHNYGKKLSKETKQKISAAISGENHPMHGKKHSKETLQKLSATQQKLTYEQAEEIRQRYKTEKTSYRKLALEYGVSKDTISNIINNKVYTK